MNELDYGQKVVLSQRRFALKALWEANDELDKKANLLLTASSVITGLVTAAALLPKTVMLSVAAFSWKADGPALLLISVLLAFALMLWMAIKIWSPKSIAAPGTQDIGIMYDKYISRSRDDAFNCALEDLVNTVEIARHVNEIKARALKWMSAFFMVQIILLMAAIAWPLLTTLF